MNDMTSKAVVRKRLKAMLEGIAPAERHRKSIAACALLASSSEFQAARVVMLFLSMPHEIDTASLALKCWQAGKTVVVPKVSWDQRRMLPVEITSLNTGLAHTGGHNILEPILGSPIPVDMIDLVVVPGLGFSPNGYRIGRGMGFYDRFLAQNEFVGASCGLGFQSQVVEDIPVLDHDMPLNMLATEMQLLHFASQFSAR